MMIGHEIPDISAPAVVPNSTTSDYVEYSDTMLIDQWLVLFFYPADFTWVCPTELQEIKDRYQEFINLNTTVWAVSTDGVEVHQEWIKKAFDGSLPYWLVSDRNWEWSHLFACINEDEGVSYRCTVIVDGNGIIRHYSVNDNNMGRNIDEILRLVSGIQESDKNGMVAQCGWTPGSEMITPGE